MIQPPVFAPSETNKIRRQRMNKNAVRALGRRKGGRGGEEKKKKCPIVNNVILASFQKSCRDRKEMRHAMPGSNLT